MEDGLLFELTDEIIDLIIFGMEDQGEDYYVNIQNGIVGSRSFILRDQNAANIDSTAIPVPEWHPSDGFQLMERFVAAIHNPVHKEALVDILSAGRGAFRNFKSYVKESEILSKQWYSHKDKIMRSRVVEWYNTNCDILKYKDIEENTDETENLILDDFVFRIDYSDQEDLIKCKAEVSIRENLDKRGKGIADFFIKRNILFLESPGVEALSVYAETLEGEYAGSITGGSFSDTDSDTKLGVVHSVWVEKKFRGMGLARHLIDQFLKEAVNRSIKTVLFELPGGSSELKSTLEARAASSIFTTMAVNIINL